MRWKANFFLNPDVTSSFKEIYWFKLTKNPPPIEESKEFEENMLMMIQSAKFIKINISSLKKLKNDINGIENEPKLLIPAHKISNFYQLVIPMVGATTGGLILQFFPRASEISRWPWIPVKCYEPTECKMPSHTFLLSVLSI